MKIQLVQVLLFSRSSGSIIHLEFKGKALKYKTGPKEPVELLDFLLVLESSICEQNSLYSRNVLPFNSSSCDLCMALLVTGLDIYC